MQKVDKKLKIKLLKIHWEKISYSLLQGHLQLLICQHPKNNELKTLH